MGAGYFDDFARVLAHAGFRAVAVNPRGAGESAGPMEGLTLHHFAADIAGVIETFHCAPAHVLGHAFGNRVARCLAVDRPELVRSLTLLAAGGLIAPDAEAQAALRPWFRHDATASKRLEAMRCMVADPTSAQQILRQVTRWPIAAAAQIAANRATPVKDWWGERIELPLCVVQELEDRIAPPGNGYALREQLGQRVSISRHSSRRSYAPF